MRTKQELIANCDNEHDRKLMITELDKFQKVQNRSYLLAGLGILSIVGGCILMNLGFDYGILGIITSFFLFVGSGINMLKGSGLF